MSELCSIPVRGRRLAIAFVVAIIVVHGALLVYESLVTAPTADEPAHVAAGLSHWQRNSYELYRVNPPLVRMLATLPALAQEPATDYRSVHELARSEWLVSLDFIEANGARVVTFVRHGRLVCILWSMLGALLVFLWARDLYGLRAGCLAAAIWCIDPLVLGHGQLMTPDVASTVIGFGATYAFWKYLERPTHRRCVGVALLLGLAQLTKFTQLALYGLWPVLWWIQRARRPHAHGGKRTAAVHAAILVIGSLIVINAGYGCSRVLPRLGDLPFFSQSLAGELTEPPPPLGYRGEPYWLVGNRFEDGWLGDLVLPVPADFIRGLDVQQADFEDKRPSYLRGELRDHGWWYYYLYALAVKVPLGVWVLGLWAVILGCTRRSPVRAGWRDELMLLVPAAGFLILLSAKTGLNHHLRYALPLYPYLIVSMSKLAVFVTRETWRRGALVIAAWLAAAISSLAVFPHSLSYFNELAGGPQHGDRHLVDSNIDWGQDLLRLRRWVKDTQPADPLQLAYFGPIDPTVVGLSYRLPPRRPASMDVVLARRSIRGPEIPSELQGPRPGLHAVSVNFIRGVRYPLPNGRGPWEPVLFDDFTYFQQFEPIARVGYSIRIFCIGQQQANVVRARLGLPPTTDPDPACRATTTTLGAARR